MTLVHRPGIRLWRLTRLIVQAVFLVGIALATSTTLAQYPNRAVKIVVPYGAGGPTDLLARVLAEEFSRAWGESVLVENRPGAGGNIGASAVARAMADGYTLAVVPSGLMVINPLLFKQMPFDPLKDFTPITQLGSGPIILFVSPKLPVTSLSDLARYAKDNPGKLNFTSSGIGTIPHLAGELLMQEAGVKMVHVPFASVPQALGAVMSGEVDLMFDSSSALPHAAAGRLKALAVLSKARFEGAPNIPTTVELGFPRVTVDAWYGLLAPANTPAAVVEKIRADAFKILHSAQAKSKLAPIGFMPAANAPRDFAEAAASESGYWKRMFSTLDIQPQ